MSWHKSSTMNSVLKHVEPSAVVQLSECRKHNVLFTEYPDCQWCTETDAGAVGQVQFMVDRQHELKGHCKCCKYSTNYNVQLTHQYWSWFAQVSSVYWPGIEVMTSHLFRIISPLNRYCSQTPLPESVCMTPGWVHPKVEICNELREETMNICCCWHIAFSLQLLIY